MANRSTTLVNARVPPLSGRFEEIGRAMLPTLPPPAGDPSTRKQTAKRITKKTVELRAKFRAAHAKGMEALQRHDFDTLGNVIAEESQILDEQAALLNARREEEATALWREIAVLIRNRKKARRAKKKTIATSELLKTIRELLALLDRTDVKAHMTPADLNRLERVVRQQRKDVARGRMVLKESLERGAKKKR